MSPLVVSAIVFGCLFVGAMLAMLAARILPEHHLASESKDSIKQAMALVATLSALVLGLLIATAKGTYDTQANSVRQIAADAVLLDHVLARYGPETRELRGLVRTALEHVVARLFPEHGSAANLAPGEARAQAEAFYAKIAALSPQTEALRQARDRALQIAASLEQTRLRLFAQKDGSVPVPFLVVLVFWMVILFAGFGLLAPANPTVILALVACMASAAGALFLILEMDRPFEGIMRISSAPLREALAQLGG